MRDEVIIWLFSKTKQRKSFYSASQIKQANLVRVTDIRFSIKDIFQSILLVNLSNNYFQM